MSKRKQTPPPPAPREPLTPDRWREATAHQFDYYARRYREALEEYHAHLAKAVESAQQDNPETDYDTANAIEWRTEGLLEATHIASYTNYLRRSLHNPEIPTRAITDEFAKAYKRETRNLITDYLRHSTSTVANLSEATKTDALRKYLQALEGSLAYATEIEWPTQAEQQAPPEPTPAETEPIDAENEAAIAEAARKAIARYRENRAQGIAADIAAAYARQDIHDQL